MISAKLLNEYRRALTTIVEAGHSLMANTFADMIEIGGSPADLRDEMILAAWGATSDLGNLASVAAADFYETVRASEVAGESFQAWLAELPDLAEIQRQGHMSARFLFDREGPGGRVYKADPDMFFREMVANTERLIIDAARDTVLGAAERDSKPPLVAVLAQYDACKFCLNAMNAGWTLPARFATRVEIFHEHCRCITAPSWEQTPRVEGVEDLKVAPQYDPNPF